MPRTCTVCTHPERAAIDQVLAVGEPLRNIAERFGLSTTAVFRHRVEHLPPALVKAQEAAGAEQAIDIVKQLKAINGASLQILNEARQTGNGELALKAIDRIQRQIELQAKLLGDLEDGPTVNVLLAPEWVSIRAGLLAALGPFPDARAAVAQQLLSLGAANGHG